MASLFTLLDMEQNYYLSNAQSLDMFGTFCSANIYFPQFA